MRAARHPNGSIPLFFNKRHSHCFPGSVGSLCARQHTRWRCFSLHLRQNLTASPKLVTTIGPQPSSPLTVLTLVATLQRLDSSSGYSILPPSALQFVILVCCIISLQFCNSALFPRFCLHHCPVLVRLTIATLPGPLFLRCSGSLPHLRAPLRCAGPHVRMSDTARSQPWRPPGRGSDRATSGGGLDGS